LLRWDVKMQTKKPTFWRKPIAMTVGRTRGRSPDRRFLPPANRTCPPNCAGPTYGLTPDDAAADGAGDHVDGQDHDDGQEQNGGGFFEVAVAQGVEQDTAYAAGADYTEHG